MADDDKIRGEYTPRVKPVDPANPKNKRQRDGPQKDGSDEKSGDKT